MPVARVSGLNLYFERQGVESGPRVLLISGTGNDLRTEPQRAEHPLVLAGFDVLMFDQRGLGQSDKPDVTYSMADYADDAALLMTSIGWASASVVGISFGGMVAQHLAICHPGSVEHLVLACTSSGGEGGSSFDLLTIHALPDNERIRISASIMDTRNDVTTTPPTWAPGFEKLARTSAASRRFAALDPASPVGALRQLEARAAHNTWNDLSLITVPVLCIGGRFDGQAPPENMQNLSDQLQDSHLELFDGGHGFLVQDLSAWPRVVEWLRQNR